MGVGRTYRCWWAATVAVAVLLAQSTQVRSQEPGVQRERTTLLQADDSGIVKIPNLGSAGRSRVQLAGLADELTSPLPVPQVLPNAPRGRSNIAQQPRSNSALSTRRQASPVRKQSGTAAPAEKYILRETTARDPLYLELGVPHILTLRQPPLRTYIPESGADKVAIRYIDPESPHRLAIEPLAAGNTTLTMWFRDESSPDGEEPVSWIIHVTGKGGESPLEPLQREINYAFPNSSIQLSWVGSQVLLRGKARDTEEAAQIARIVSASIPGRLTDPDEAIIQQAAFLAVDSELIENAGSLLGAVRGDNQTGLNQGRINNRVINMLEIAGVHQVTLKVTVAEVNRSASRAIGADLQIGTAGDAVRFFTTLGTATNGGTLVLDRGDFDLAISALKRLDLARSLAEPTLTTLNGQPANFNVGGSFPIPIVTGQTATGLQGVDFQNFGVQLRFVPVVTDGDRIRLTLQASVSTRDEAAAAQVGNTNVPGLNTRDFSNTVELREGQTLAVAGLIQTNLGGNSARVPFAGDVPVLGRLFSNDGTSYDEQELVILVTPYLVAPVDTEHCPLPVPGSDYFDPDDVEFFLYGSLTGHIAEDYRTPVRSDIHKMKAFRRCEQLLIIGQPGHSNGLLCPAPMSRVSATGHGQGTYAASTEPLTGPPPDWGVTAPTASEATLPLQNVQGGAQ